VRQRLTETTGDDAQPLDIHGRRVIDCHEQLAGILRNRLGRDHADFFAQPAPAAGSRAIVWYTALSGEIASVTTLPPDEQQRLTQRAERILGDVKGLAAASASDGPAGATVGELLRAAAHVASGAPLFSVGGKVVAVLWGHRSSNTAHPVPEFHSRQTPRTEASSHGSVQADTLHTAAEPTVARNAPAPRRHWLVPTLIALFAVALLAWAWQSGFLFPSAGPGDELGAQIAAVEARNQTLAARIAELKKNPGAVKCVPEPVPSPGKQSPAKQSRSPSAITLASRGFASTREAAACAGSHACPAHVIAADAAGA
jgi:hypothetical protein